MLYNDINDSVEWLKKQEGFRAKPYWDVNRMSIGYGTPANGLNNISEQDATNSMIDEIQNRRAQLGKDYPLGISPWAKKALDDRLYNAGANAVRGSKFLANLKNLDEDSAANELLNWNKKRVNGKLVEDEGLTNRVRDLYNSRSPASETQTYDSSKSPFFQQPYVKEQLESLKPSNEPYKSFLQQQEDSKKYVDDGFRMMGVEGGEAPESYINLNRLFSNDVPSLSILPKTSFNPIQSVKQPIEETKPEETQTDTEVENDPRLGEQSSPDITDMSEAPKTPEITYNTTNNDESNKVHPLLALMDRYNNLRVGANHLSNQNILLANLAKAAQTIGAGIAHSKPNYSVADSIIEQSGRGPANVVEDLKNQLSVYKSMQNEKQKEIENKLKNRQLDVTEKYYNDLIEARKTGLADKLKMDEDKASQGWTEGFIKRTNPLTAGAKTNLGKARIVETQVDNALSMLAGHKPGDITNIELKELLRDFDTIVSGGQATVGGYKSLDAAVSSLKRDWTQLKDYMTGKPNEMATPELLNRLKNTMIRIKNLSNKNQYLARKEEARSGFKYKDTDSFKNALYDLQYPEDIFKPEEEDRNAKAFDSDIGIKTDQPHLIEVEGRQFNASPEQIENLKKDNVNFKVLK